MGEERLVSGPSQMDRQSCSFTACTAPYRPSQPLVAAHLLPDASNACGALRRLTPAKSALLGTPSRGSGAAALSRALRAIDSGPFRVG